jgi:hypothetical protein
MSNVVRQENQDRKGQEKNEGEGKEHGRSFMSCAGAISCINCRSLDLGGILQVGLSPRPLTTPSSAPTTCLYIMLGARGGSVVCMSINDCYPTEYLERNGAYSPCVSPEGWAIAKSLLFGRRRGRPASYASQKKKKKGTGAVTAVILAVDDSLTKIPHRNSHLTLFDDASLRRQVFQPVWSTTDVIASVPLALALQPSPTTIR